MNLIWWASDIPRIAGWSHDARLLADPYRYLQQLMAARDSDALQLRLMGEPTLCIAGGEAVDFFYDAERIQRRHAAPEPLRATLFGKGGVQGLDGSEHRHRKALFLQMLNPASVAALVARTRREWLIELARWQNCDELNLYRALQPLLTAAVCNWAGLPLAPQERQLRTRQLVSMFDEAAGGLVGHLRSRWRRREAEAWARQCVEAVRGNRRQPPDDSVLALVARHRDERGALLPADIAAVELLNVLRPVVAVFVFMVSVAHALQEHPSWARRLRDRADGDDALRFVQEIRRHYPFFPLLAGRTRGLVKWRSARIPAGMRVILDVHGTNHSARDWVEPDRFEPERWHSFAAGLPRAFVPQGGAQAAGGHRCPGEDLAVQLMLLTLEIFLFRLHYRAEPQPSALDFGRMPALPEGGMLIRHVRASHMHAVALGV